MYCAIIAVRLGQLSTIIHHNHGITTRIMVTIKKRAGVIPYSFSSSIALLSSLLSCSFYLLDQRTISSVDKMFCACECVYTEYLLDSGDIMA